MNNYYHNVMLSASRRAAATKDSNRRYELQVMEDDWKSICQAGDIAVLTRLVRVFSDKGQKARVFDWVDGVTVKG